MADTTPLDRRARLPAAPPCPFCGGERTELMSPFGAHASVATYWCLDCRSPFEIFRWRDRPGPSEPESS